MSLWAQDAQKRIVAYVTSWSTITPDPSVMTHINYAFGGVGADGTSVYADGTSRMQSIVRLKSKNPNLKVLLSIGGWGRGNFSPMAKDAAKRKAFAQACRKFCDKYNLDGIDVDWEFPGNNSSGESSPSNEKQNYSLLMRDLREALGSDLLLTMASSADPGYYDFSGCIKYLDFVNVMTYDMSGPPNHHSALYRGGKVGNGWLVQSESIQRHLKAGIPASKLVMGLAFYGNSGSGSQISLQQIRDGIASGKWTDHWDDTAKVPYVTDSKGTFAYGYDDERSLTLKCQYILKNKLAGAMYWEYANDDRQGTERNTVYNCLIGSSHGDVFFGDTQLNYIGGNEFAAAMDLVSGASYRVSGADETDSPDWYCDPDFFSRQADGSFRFFPLSGKYRVAMDFFNRAFRVTPLDADGSPLTYNAADGSGCIWVCGAPASIGKPAFEEEGSTDLSAENLWPMAAIGNNKYRITLEVGKQLNPNMVNFKFFQRNEMTDSEAFSPRGKCHIGVSSNIFMINTSTTQNGNVKLRSGQSLTPGTRYSFIIDSSNPDFVILSVDDVTSGVDNIRTDYPHTVIDLWGRPVTNLRSGQIFIDENGKKRIKSKQ